MIQIICKSEAYTYNVYHIVKAFFPSEEVIGRVEEKASHYVMVQLPDAEEIVIGNIDKNTEVFLKPVYEEQPQAGEGKDIKYRIDVRLYHELKRITGRTLAWGILTGVRPTKIAMEKAEEGWTKEQFVPWFQQDCLVSRKKAELSWEIARREQALLQSLDCEEGYSLYIGIPFCPTVCTYCSFSSGALADWADRVEDYLAALTKELIYIAEKSVKKRLNTIYIGGGTPTTLTASQLERLLECIDTHFSREYLLEYTVEAGRPDSITRDRLEVLRKHGITRLSVNPQSMQQKTLDTIGRKHRVEEVPEAFCLARRMGFDNINMDLIAGLPGEDAKDMEDTLRQIRELLPDSLTVHSLAIKRAAKMEWADLKTDADKISRTLSEMVRMSSDAASQMGMTPYYLYRQKNIAGNFENVGYAKVDKAGIYNILIMEEKQSIIAAGAGASTKIVLKEPIPVPGSKKRKMTHLIRVENVKAIDAYIDRIDEMIERKGEWLWR
ncbi:MAG: coproporphyrinogen dehydrogenase HemZ [Dorea sp.]|nr:coproporphyrinogen dehydrogenase HemZ [Dorea sp.]